jgi:hypothetical protein
MSNIIKSTTVATINKQEIVIIENGEKRIAIKPICDALGVNFSSQLQKLKTDPILSSTVAIITTVGADKKDREMVTIPFKFVFGWLFTIDSRKVNLEAQEFVLKYQREVYDILYEHFTEMDEYLTYRTKLAEEKFDLMESAREDFKTAKSKLDQYKEEFAAARALTLQDFKAMKAQTVLEFPKEEGGAE